MSNLRDFWFRPCVASLSTACGFHLSVIICVLPRCERCAIPPSMHAERILNHANCILRAFTLEKWDWNTKIRSTQVKEDVTALCIDLLFISLARPLWQLMRHVCVTSIQGDPHTGNEVIWQCFKNYFIGGRQNISTSASAHKATLGWGINSHIF